MATLIAPGLWGRDEDDGELRVAECLRDAKDTDGWVVMHSTRVPDVRERRSGKLRPKPEVDFIVLIPDYGFVVLEVKSGRGRRRGDTYYLWDDKNAPEETPFQQAGTNHSILMSNLAAKFPDRAHPARQSPTEDCVIFPDLGVTYPNPEAEHGGFQCEVFEASHLQDNGAGLVRGLLRLLRRHYGRPAPSLETVEEVRKALWPSLGATDSLEMIADRLEKLTEDQSQILEMTERHPRMVVEGSAGTGKSFLAARLANRRTRKGERVALFCHTDRFARWLQERVVEGVDVLPILSWPNALLEEHLTRTRELVKEMGLFPITVLDHQRMFAPVALQLVRDTGLKYDYIVVDEAQSFNLEEWMLLLDAMLEKGLKQGRWTFFGDFDNQDFHRHVLAGFASQLGDIPREAARLTGIEDLSFYDQYLHDPFVSEAALNGLCETLKIIKANDWLEEFCDGTLGTRPRTQTLLNNCRNTAQVATAASHIFRRQPTPVIPSKVQGLRVRYHYWTTVAEAEQVLGNIFRQLAAEGITNDQVVVLSDRRAEEFGPESEGLNTTRTYGPWRLVDRSVPAEAGVDFSLRDETEVEFNRSIACSGLEWDVVICMLNEPVWVDGGNFVASTRSRAYVGLTRAKSRLIIVPHESWDYLHIDPDSTSAENVVRTMLRDMEAGSDSINNVVNNLADEELKKKLSTYLLSLQVGVRITDEMLVNVLWPELYPYDAVNRESDQAPGDEPVGNLDGYEDREAKPTHGNAIGPDATALEAAGKTVLDAADALAQKEEETLAHNALTMSANALGAESESPQGRHHLAGNGTPPEGMSERRDAGGNNNGSAVSDASTAQPGNKNRRQVRARKRRHQRRAR